MFVVLHYNKEEMSQMSQSFTDYSIFPLYQNIFSVGNRTVFAEFSWPNSYWSNLIDGWMDG